MRAPRINTSARIKTRATSDGRPEFTGGVTAVTGSGWRPTAGPPLDDLIKDPARFPWHEACLPRQRLSRRRQVTKVQHYWLEVDALSACDARAGMTRPMEVREDETPYGEPTT
jgi:hypothetical protein